MEEASQTIASKGKPTVKNSHRKSFLEFPAANILRKLSGQMTTKFALFSFFFLQVTYVSENERCTTT